MVRRLTLFLILAFGTQNTFSESFSALETGSIWNGTINPILLPLDIEPKNNYSLNMVFPGMEKSNYFDKELAIGFANNSFKDLFLNLQSEKEKIGLGVRLFNLDYSSIIKNDQYDYSPDSSSYMYDNYKNENYSISLDGYINLKKAYQTGISISAGISRDSIISENGYKIIDNSESLYNEYYFLRLSKVIRYNAMGTILQRMKRCKKETFLMFSGGIDNSVEKYNSFNHDSDDFNFDTSSSFVEKYNYSYTVKPGIFRFRDKKRLTGLFIGTEYFGRKVRDTESLEYIEAEVAAGLNVDDNYRYTYYNRQFFLEGLYSRKIEFNNGTFSFGHDIEAAFSFSRSDSIRTQLHDSTFISLDYTIPLLFQFKIKDVLIIHSAYNMNLFIKYMLKYQIEGIEQKREDYEKAPECDFDFAATPLAFTLNLKDRIHFSFVPSFDYDGVFVYKAEMRYFPGISKTKNRLSQVK